FSFFASFLLSLPATAKQTADSIEPNVGVRLDRAKAIIDVVSEPSGHDIAWDENDPYKVAWHNWNNWNNFHNNWNNFRNSFNNFHNAPPVHRTAPVTYPSPNTSHNSPRVQHSSPPPNTSHNAPGVQHSSPVPYTTTPPATTVVPINR